MRCPYCNSLDIRVDPSRGDTTCGECGEVIEERKIISEVQFVQSSGTASLAGHFKRFSYQTGPGNSHSREIAIGKGATKIAWIADRLQLSTHIQEAGKKTYALAVELQFNTGRKTVLVASACLYLECRRNRSPQLLIDFADVLEQTVKTLGGVYMKLLRRLVGGEPGQALRDVEGVPFVDPSLFIERFARKLDLGARQIVVQATANRIVQFMHRDWICIGRRPHGLCGSALLLAARYHGLQVSADQVAGVVRMSDSTLRSRMRELRTTPLAQLTRAEFEALESADAQGQAAPLPPCRLQKRSAQAALAGPGPSALPSAPVVLADSAVGPAAVVDIGKLTEDLVDELGGGNMERAIARIGELEGWQEPSGAAGLPFVPPQGGEGAIAEPPREPAAVSGAGKAAEESEGAESLIGEDDAFLEDLLLDDEESRSKSDIWHQVNAAYLEEWYDRGQVSKRRREEAERGAQEARQRAEKFKYPQATSPAHSVAMALAQKGKVRPNRINLDALNELFE